jgi:hypothetical protein
VEFVVNYFESPTQILPFQQFDVIIKNRTQHHFRGERITNRNMVSFLNCTESNANCSRSSSYQNANQCVCLPIGNYTVEVNYFRIF